LDYIVLRAANPFGPWQDPFRRQGVVTALMRAMLDGRPVEIWGDGCVVRDYLYVVDVAEALATAAGYRGAHRVFNVGSGVGRDLHELVRDVAAALGVTGAVQALHTPVRLTDVSVNVLDASLIRREMGWAPRTPWNDALQATAAWLRGGGSP
jgi:UDP-glucose 4-epimerase